MAIRFTRNVKSASRLYAATPPSKHDRARPEATYEAFSLGENPAGVGTVLANSGDRIGKNAFCKRICSHAHTRTLSASATTSARPPRRGFTDMETPGKYNLVKPMKTPELIEIRIVAPSKHAQKVAELVALLVANTPNKTFELLKKSEPLPCRSPKQDSSRVYLEFKVKGS